MRSASSPTRPTTTCSASWAPDAERSSCRRPRTTEDPCAQFGNGRHIVRRASDLSTEISVNRDAGSDGAEIVPPNAAAMIESMRAFGYSPATAIADLVDNSITAGARTIDVRLHWAGTASWGSIADDGHGMSETGLRSAMTLGSRSPRDDRAADDLGRFGLGLKTASFSQCRSLTVASRTAATGINVRRWDLDEVARTGEWRLLTTPPPGDADGLRFIGDDSGTVVLWTR